MADRFNFANKQYIDRSAFGINFDKIDSFKNWQYQNIEIKVIEECIEEGLGYGKLFKILRDLDKKIDLISL